VSISILEEWVCTVFDFLPFNSHLQGVLQIA